MIAARRLPALLVALVAGCGEGASTAPPPSHDLSAVVPVPDLAVADAAGPADLPIPDLSLGPDLQPPPNPIQLWLSYQNNNENDLVLIADSNPPIF